MSTCWQWTARGSVKIGTTEVLVTQSTSWWVAGQKVPPSCAVGSVATSATGVVNETPQMSYVWRKYDPLSCQKALKFLNREQHCPWAWAGGGWRERSYLISVGPRVSSFIMCHSVLLSTTHLPLTMSWEKLHQTSVSIVRAPTFPAGKDR